MALPLRSPAWPGDARVAVSLTFDVDADTPAIARGDDRTGLLSLVSEARFGIVRGLPRILDLLARHSILSTFYVPGSTARRWPDEVKAIVAAGHEVAHHGHHHLKTQHLTENEQRAELLHGVDALGDVLGVIPRGYRSPSWELTRATFGLLLERGFAWDSSCMGDDRPYREQVGADELVELPIHWSLDDWPYWSWSDAERGHLSPPSSFLETWRAEFDAAHAEGGRLVTYTCHPEVIGRGYRLAALEQLIQHMRERGDVWFARHGDVADLIANGSPAS